MKVSGAVWIGFVSMGLLSATMSIFAAILMTEPGQALDLNRDWIVAYHSYRIEYGLLVVLFYAVFFYLGYVHRLWRASPLMLVGSGIVIALYVSNALLDHFFPSHHKTATYISVGEADQLLTDDETVYAVEIQGEAVAYPRRFLMLPHIAGKQLGDREVVMTYCALSDVPVVFEGSLGGQESHLGVLIQTNNNLVMYDGNSGEVIQQLTGQTEFGSPAMQTYANQMMSWKSFKAIYPNGEVFEYRFDRWLDTALLAVFDEGLKKQYDPNQGPMFPTLALADQRLPQKEHVWGLNLNGKQVAFTRTFVSRHPLHNTQVGGTPIVLRFDAELDTLGIFYRKGDSEVMEIDVYGNTPEGKLQRVPSFNGVFWMVWSHFYPNTSLRHNNRQAGQDLRGAI